MNQLLKDGKLDEAICFIEKVAEEKNPLDVPLLVHHLEQTNNNILRNALAMALADIGDSRCVEPIIKLLADPKTHGSRGTLLYALENFDYSSHIVFITRLLANSSFEVSSQSFQLLLNIAGELPYSIKIDCLKVIKQYLTTGKNELLEEALELLS